MKKFFADVFIAHRLTYFYYITIDYLIQAFDNNIFFCYNIENNFQDTFGHMNKLTLNIQMQLNKLGAAEQRAANFIIENPKAVIPLSISELANRSKTSEATVTRLSKKLGFEGYQQLKIAIVQDTGTQPIRTDICASDTAGDIFAKLTEDIYCSLEKTKKVLNGEALSNVCQAILQADEIMIFGLGNSASVATDTAHKLLRLGLNAHAYTDNHMQTIVASHSNQKTLAIGISHSGSSKDIVRALRLCKENGAVTACVTNYGKSPIYRVSDYVLNTVANETNYTILGLNSRIAQLAIVDAIYCYLVCHLENAKEAIHQTEEALQSKKY